VVAPITTPMDNASSVNKSVWLPPGHWVDWLNPTEVIVGPTVIHRAVAVEDTPVYLRACSVIPTQLPPNATSHLTPLSSRDRTLADVMQGPVVWVMAAVEGPAANETDTYNGRIYDDDGATMAYRTMANNTGASTPITVHLQRSASAVTSIHAIVGPSEGSFPEQPDTRAHWLELRGLHRLPRHVSCRNQPGSAEATDTGVVVRCPDTPFGVEVNIKASW